MKTNKAVGLRRQAQRDIPADSPLRDESSFLQRTTEHCLVGIKGLVRRSQVQRHNNETRPPLSLSLSLSRSLYIYIYILSTP